MAVVEIGMIMKLLCNRVLACGLMVLYLPIPGLKKVDEATRTKTRRIYNKMALPCTIHSP
jgi:hypothetical protein